MIKLNNTEWISDQITVEDMMGWKMGDIITIEAGTGTGKSEFIKNDLYAKAKVEGRKILFLVHRENCYDQFENDIKGKEDVIKLMMYQTIEVIRERGDSFNFSNYDYIVADEFHYFTADSGLNNKTDLSLEAILAETDKVRIFMSATADLVTNYLSRHRKFELISYKADLDFSFINELHFYNDNHTEEIIINDIVKSGEKAIIFINKFTRLEEVYLKYRDISLFNCAKNTKQYKYVDEDKINNMLYSKMFEEQLLFSTSAMDTGVSIKDRQVKHIICNNILDVNVLIQVIGRKRMMDEDDKVNIYIKNVINRDLNGHIRKANIKLDKVKCFKENGQGVYTDKYEREFDDKAILYYKNVDGKITVEKNDMPYFKTKLDRLHYRKMLDKGYKAYISKLFGNMAYTNIDIELEKESLEDYLNNIVGEEMFVGDEIRNNFIEKVNLRNRNNRLVRDYDTIAPHIAKEFDKKFILIDKPSYKKDTYRKKYWKVIYTG